tara:strand:+ start:118 stop:564 length:447 start_codon:yes stop_codon:yes gene_type:complete
MEKLLRFRRANGSEAYYPVSSFLGATAFAGDTGAQSMRLHFKPLRATNKEQTGTADSDFDTDTISITITPITTSNSIATAVANMMRAVAASNTVIVNVFILGSSKIVTNNFTSKRAKFDETNRICTPNTECDPPVTNWNDVLKISTVR